MLFKRKGEAYISVSERERLGREITRRNLLARAARMGLAAPFASGTLSAAAGLAEPLPQQLPELPAGRPLPYRLTLADELLLDELERAACLYFWEQGSPDTGLIKDRSTPSEFDDYNIASIAATGFGLTALCIADHRKYIPHDRVVQRVLAALRFLDTKMYQQRGFFFHFVEMDSGDRAFECEVSSIDTGILLCGILMCRQYFDNAQIQSLATEIYDRMDWVWMLDHGRTLSHGWTPEHGFLRYRWNTYCELMLIYLLAIGSRTHPIPPSSWDAWWRPIFEYHGLRFIGSYAPIFVHQYSHAWFDFRRKSDKYTNYFQNSVLATKAHRTFCILLRRQYPDFGPNLWGITASDSESGYTWWGGPPPVGPIDGTVVPCAVAGSLPFLPRECLRVLHAMRLRYGAHLWKRYAYQDAFNPLKRWYNPDVIGIDIGISVLMAENLRTNFVWDTFMKNPEAQRGMDLVGFKASPEEPAEPEPRRRRAPLARVPA